MGSTTTESAGETRSPMRHRLRRGVFIVPTFLTVMNVFFGFMAILLAIRGSQANAIGDPLLAGRMFRLACWALVVSAVFDTFDGLVARMMNATTEFGKEYDSLADVVTFGAAPAILVYCWGLHQLKGLGGGIAFLFLVAGSLRLARFNIMTGKTDHRYFVGLPIPAGALTLAAIINFAPQPIVDKPFAIVMMLVTIGVAFSMVSTIRYRSQKFSLGAKRIPFPWILFFVLLVALLWRWPEEFLFLAAIGYISSGPLVRLWTIVIGPRAADLDDTVPARVEETEQP